jgi:hypothetical protein
MISTLSTTIQGNLAYYMATISGEKWLDAAENLWFYHLRSKNFGLNRDFLRAGN